MAPATPETKTRPNARWWVKVFVVLHLLAITIWTIPTPGQQYLTGRLKPEDRAGIGGYVDRFLVANEAYGKRGPVRFYVQATGFWQYWDMFSPNPASIDYYCTVTLQYKDGTTKEYQYPRVYLLSIYQKYAAERYRKFFERARDLDYLFKPFAQHVAALNTTDKSNPVVHVDLHVHSQQIAPPGKPQPTEYADKTYYQGNIDQAQLMRDLSG